MRRGLIVLGLLLVLVASPRVRAEEEGKPDGETPAGTPSEEEIRRRNRERWERMTPEERKKAIERLRKFQKLSDAEKRRLRDKARRGVGSMTPEQRELMAREKKRLVRMRNHMQQTLAMMWEKCPEEVQSRVETLPRPERHELERYVLTRLFEFQFAAALDRLPVEIRERIEKLSPVEQRRAIREVFEEYRRQILDKMPQEVRRQIEALPTEQRREETNEYVLNVMDRDRVELASRKIVPELGRLLSLEPDDRRKLIREKISEFGAHRHGPPGWHGQGKGRTYRPLSEEERKRIHERLRAWLRGQGLPNDEIDGLLKLPPHEFWRKLKETHPELFERRSPKRRGGEHGRSLGGRGRR